MANSGSDGKEGDGWWLSVDGNWYPPEEAVNPSKEPDAVSEDALHDQPDGAAPPPPPPAPVPSLPVPSGSIWSRFVHVVWGGRSLALRIAATFTAIISVLFVIGVLTDGPSGQARVINDAVDAMEQGQLDEAVALFTEVIESGTDDTEIVASAYANRAFALAELGLAEEAVADGSAAIDLAPDVDTLAQAYLGRAIDLATLGRTHEAVSDLRSVLELVAPRDERYPLAEQILEELLAGESTGSGWRLDDGSWQTYCTDGRDPTYVNSARRENEIVLDGVMTPGSAEWTEATSIFLPLQLPWSDPDRYDPCVTHMTAWFANDDQWLYGLYHVAWEQPVGSDDSGGIALFRGEACCGVDSDFGTVGFSPALFGGVWDAHGWDTLGRWVDDLESDPPGTTDFEGAATHDGTGYWFEWRKRLDSGDPGDWVLEPGQEIGDATTQTWFLANFWDQSEGKSYEHTLAMTLAEGIS